MNYQSEFVAPEKLQNNGLQLSLVGLFGDLHGFKGLLDLLEMKQEGQVFKCPISIICLVAQSFTRLRDLGVESEVVVEMAGKLAKCIEERLQDGNFTDAEIKEVHTDDIKLLIKLLSIYKHQSGQANEHEVQELYELWLAKRYLMCPFFEMRIKGMKEFKQIEDKVVAGI
jgi:hypothetical protein